MRLRAALLLLPLLLAAPAPEQQSLSSQIDEGVRKIAGFGFPAASPRCDDGEFLRRVMLDLVGYPPNSVELHRFLSDPDPDKRGAMIDVLLQTDRFADFWARRWMAVFFGNYHVFRQEPLKSLDPDDAARILEHFRRWLQERLQQDASWSNIVRDLLEAQGPVAMNPAVAYKLGTMGWPRRPYYENRAVQQFLGIDMSCTGCHDHPFDNWRVEDGYSLMAFSTGRRLENGPRGLEIREEPASPDRVVRMPTIRENREDGRDIAPPKFFIGALQPERGEVLAKAFARMLTASKNDQFSNAAVNRVWSWLLGRGLTHPVDDFNLKNKCVAPALLKTLGEEFRRSGYSFRFLVRSICRSDTYQRRADGPGPYEKPLFARGLVRPLSAEQILNSLETATRGRPTFDVLQAQALAEVMVRGDRPICEVAEVPVDPRAMLWLANSDRVWSLIREGNVVARLRAMKEGRVKEMFLAALSRPPGADEARRFDAFLQDHTVDEAYWALLNSVEFLTRH
jgi:hypothetical protein